MRRATLVIAIILALCSLQHKASAQFYKPVVRLMGTITETHGKPVVARVSVRDADDTTKEIVSSTSNSSTGKYLAILKPDKTYLVLVHGDSLISQSVKILTPNSDHNEQIVQDFTVQFLQPVHTKPLKEKPSKATKPKSKKLVKKKK